MQEANTDFVCKFPRSLKRRLREVADENDCTMSSIVTRALELYMAEHFAWPIQSKQLP